MGRPLLRPERIGSGAGGLPLLFGRESTDRRHQLRDQRWSRGEEAGGVGRDGRRGLSPLLIYSPRVANRRPPRSQVMITPFCMQQGLVKSGSCRGSVGKWRSPRPISRHTSTKATGCWGPRRSALRFAVKPSPSAPWAPGLLSAFWERGSPELPACGLRRGSRGGPVRPIFINSSSRPSRGAKPRGADDTRLHQGRPQ